MRESIASIETEALKPPEVSGSNDGMTNIQRKCCLCSHPAPVSDLKGEVQSRLRGSFGLLDKTLSQQPPDLSHLHPFFIPSPCSDFGCP